MQPTLPDDWNVRFHHLRRVDADGRKLPKGGGTVAFLYDPSHNLAGIGLAYVHPNDNYSRPIGRAISLGRAMMQAGVHPRSRRVSA